MAGLMTSFDVIWRHYQQKWYHLVEQAQGYLINVNLFCYALTERNPRGRFHPPLPCTTGGRWGYELACTSKADKWHVEQILNNDKHKDSMTYKKKKTRNKKQNRKVILMMELFIQVIINILSCFNSVKRKLYFFQKHNRTPKETKFRYFLWWSTLQLVPFYQVFVYFPFVCPFVSVSEASLLNYYFWDNSHFLDFHKNWDPLLPEEDMFL